MRVDTAAHADAVISPYYDSLIAKLIVHGRDRAEAIARMRRALEMFVVEGIKTSLPLHQRIFADPDFEAGKPRHALSGAPAARARRSSTSAQMSLVFPPLYAIIDALAQDVGAVVRRNDGGIRG